VLHSTVNERRRPAGLPDIEDDGRPAADRLLNDERSETELDLAALAVIGDGAGEHGDDSPDGTA